MSDLPIREQALQALTERLGARRGLGSYDKAALPLTIVVEEDDEVQSIDFDAVRVLMPVTLIRVVAKAGIKNDAWHEDANVEQAQLQVDAIGGDETLGDLVDSMEYAGGGIVVDDGASGYVARVRLAVRYSFKRGNPFERAVNDWETEE